MANREQQSAVDVLSSLLRQFVGPMPLENFPSELTALYHTRHFGGRKSDLESLLSIITSLCSKFSSMFIVLDALDECCENELQILLPIIERLSAASFRILATGRLHLNIFANSPTIQIIADIDDVKNFLTTRVAKKTNDSALKKKIVDSIAISAKEMYVVLVIPKSLMGCRFLMAEAQLNYVLSFRSGRRMKEALEGSVPAKLFVLYDDIMETIFRSDERSSERVALKVLSWIYHAKRPLTMAELREAIEVREHDVSLEEDDLTPEKDIIEECRSLVRYDVADGVVSFSHEQVREYLGSKHMDNLMTEVELAKICLSYLLFDVFEEGPCVDESSFADRLRTRPFGRYAACYWGKHTKGPGENDSRIQNMLFTLMQSSAKRDSVTQLSIAKKTADWNLGIRNKTLLHFIAENNLLTLAEIVLNGNMLNVRPASLLVIFKDTNQGYLGVRDFL